MNPLVVKTMYRPAIKRAAYACLVGRNRDRTRLDKGRFTRPEVDEILDKVWQSYHQLAPTIPHEPKLGNRMNMLLACITLSCLRAMLSAEIERGYAIELIGDIAWKVYEKWGRIPLFVAGLLTRNPREQMSKSVKMFLKFPFSPPGYVFVYLPSIDGISFDMLRCPVAEYFQSQYASDLGTGTWCNLDFPLAELWGGWLERTGTLSSGSTRCDFRFRAVNPEG